MSLTAPFELEHVGAERRRWIVCAAIVIGLHAVPIIVAAWWLRPLTSIAAPPPPAVMIDMAPLPAAPSAPATKIPPGPARPRVETPAPPQPDKTPSTPRVASAVVSLPASQDTPPHPQDKTPVREATAPPTAAAPPAPAAAPAPTASIAPSNAAPTWQGLVLGRLERFRRYPALAQSRAQQGVAYLRFTMDRNGKVLSANIAQSSGYGLLDAEALALVRRAQPLPKPPPEVPGDTLELVAPIQFFLSGHR
jgi:protein TonB